MKRNLLSTICALLIFVTGFSQSKPLQKTKKTNNKKEIIVASNGNLTKKQVKELRKKHAYYLANNKVNKTFAMSEDDRLAAGLPPNKYLEQEWLMSMNPALGRPTPEITLAIQKDLNDKLENGRVPGDGMDNQWVERGPDNVGGRTRALMYDPNDPTHDTIWAGGVDGGGVARNLLTNCDGIIRSRRGSHYGRRSLPTEPIRTHCVPWAKLACL